MLEIAANIIQIFCLPLHRTFATEMGIMVAKAWYKDWFNSPYYHLLYQHRDESEANRFIAQLIQFLNPQKGSLMLDIACGKGRHSIALAEMGFEVTGIDLSDASITEAKKYESDYLHFYQHDMRCPFRINYFQYAFNFFTSFGYFETKREHDNALRTMCESLQSKGVLVIDYLNIHHSEAAPAHTYTQQIAGVCFHINKWQNSTHFYKQIQVIEEGQTDLKDLYTERVAKFSLADFNKMLSSQQMQVEEVFGDYQLGQYDLKKSPRLILLARKK